MKQIGTLKRINIDAKVAEVFELIGETYKKISDAQDVAITFDIGECSINFDFSTIWP